MAKRLVYIPITLLFIFSATALILHYANIGEVQANLMREARLPFGYLNGRVYVIATPDAAPDVRIGDGIESINGRVMDSERTLVNELKQMRPGEPITIKMVRRIEGGSVEKYDATVVPIQNERD